MVNDRKLSAAAASAAEPQEIVFQHTVLCQTCMPYRDPGATVRRWARSQGAAHLEIEAGRAFHPARGEYVDLGLPFGPKPRLVLCHLNAEALRTGAPTIEVEDSLTAFARRVGLAGHGRDLRVIKDQLARLAAAEIRLAVAYDQDRAGQAQMHVVSGFELWFPKDERQRVLWPTTIRLGLDYFASLTRHAVPLDERAIGALRHSAMGLDIYAWLAQRLHRVPPGRPQLVPWVALRDQFGAHYQRVRKFREVFLGTLAEAVRHYPAARIETDERGLTIRNSPPPVAPRIARG